MEDLSLNQEKNLNKRKTKYRFKFLNISNATKAHCLQDFQGSLRTDVLYKTIIRDLRKFYSNDFNQVTQFIKRKRYKNESYFFQCLREYLAQRFSSIFVMSEG